jgi:signal transduction histidine kinase
MKKKKITNAKLDLRLRAEKKVKENKSELSQMTVEDMQYLIHELHVHQIELEMQNEHLHEAQTELENSLKKYADLFNSAPVAYLTLDETGTILEINNTAIQLLRLEEKKIKNSNLKNFVAPDYRDFYYLFLKKVFTSQGQQLSDFELMDTFQKKFSAELICTADPVAAEGTGKTCRLAIVNTTEQRKAMDIIKNSMQEKERLNIILNTQEQERKRIAEALHNGVGQVIYTIKIKLDQLLKNVPLEKEAKDLKMLIRDAIQDVKSISYELVPTILEDFGLVAVINNLCKKLENADIKVNFSIYGYDKRLALTIEISIFRIIQELINNIIKHSGAKEAGIFITISDNIILRVEDNGVGYVGANAFASNQGMGLLNIKNRVNLLNGTIEINSQKHKGTTVIITINKQASINTASPAGEDQYFV